MSFKFFITTIFIGTFLLFPMASKAETIPAQKEIIGTWTATSCKNTNLVRVFSKYFTLYTFGKNKLLMRYDFSRSAKDFVYYSVGPQEMAVKVINEDMLAINLMPYITMINKEPMQWDFLNPNFSSEYTRCTDEELKIYWPLNEELMLNISDLDFLVDTCGFFDWANKKNCQNEAFSKIDFNQDLVIDKKEMRRFLFSLEQFKTALSFSNGIPKLDKKSKDKKKAVSTIFKVLDEDGSETISLTEITANLNKLKKRKETRWIFDYYKELFASISPITSDPETKTSYPKDGCGPNTGRDLSVIEGSAPEETIDNACTFDNPAE
jgi:Ca2+-binding EF-hand superfamily protein